MAIDINYVFFICGLLLVISVLASKVSSLFGTPILLLFLAVGMLTGEDGVFIKIVYNDYSSAYFISNFMLALILLDGGLRTNFSTFKAVISESVVLATIGVVITSFITGCVAYLVFDLSFIESLLVGSIVGSTDAAAVFMLLGNGGVSLKEKVSSILQIESATNDPMAILLTLVLLALLSGQAQGAMDVVTIFVSQFGLGIIIGIVVGLFSRFLVSYINLSAGLYTILVLGLGFAGFAITASLGGSGFLAIFIIGMCIGNQNNRSVSYILPVGEGITWLAQITLFLMLGLLVTPSHLIDYVLPASAVAFALAFIARPVAVFLCMKLFFKQYSLKELLFISWVGLRGSVPIVLALYPVMGNINNAQLFFNVAFIVVLFSLFFQGASILPFAKICNVYAPTSVAPINKSQVGIMLSDDFELYNYKVTKESIDGVKLRDIRFPKRTSVAAIFRDGHLIKAQGDTMLQNDDIVSIIGSNSDERILNSIFSRELFQKRLERYTGDIILSGDKKMTDLEKEYGVELTTFEETMTLSEFMSYHIGGFAQIGDAIGLINISLHVLELSGDRVSRVGLTKIE